MTPLTGKQNRGFAVHERSRITERLNDFHDLINVVVYTECLDDEELNFVVKKWVFKVCHINHFYSAENDESRFYAIPMVGLDYVQFLAVSLTGFFFPSSIPRRLHRIGFATKWRRLEGKNQLFLCFTATKKKSLLGPQTRHSSRLGLLIMFLFKTAHGVHVVSTEDSKCNDVVF